MALTKSELIGSLKNEVRILLHLAGKLDQSMLDYRPTPKQRMAQMIAGFGPLSTLTSGVTQREYD